MPFNWSCIKHRMFGAILICVGCAACARLLAVPLRTRWAVSGTTVVVLMGFATWLLVSIMGAADTQKIRWWPVFVAVAITAFAASGLVKEARWQSRSARRCGVTSAASIGAAFALGMSWFASGASAN